MNHKIFSPGMKRKKNGDDFLTRFESRKKITSRKKRRKERILEREGKT